MEPRPQGNPAALAAVAAQLSSYADRLAELAAGVNTVLPQVVFVGPGRAQHDAEFDHASAQAKAAAHTLSLEASLLSRESGELRTRQHQWDTRKHAEDERRRHEAEKAANACLVNPPR